ncbi:MAG: polysaccharide biosynthesis/export family protein, partial [Gammaproteobacteria bacterium]|nr:polysaccharide biosynthesis/export family protein [Gammaproteobacteria bacterium]
MIRVFVLVMLLAASGSAFAQVSTLGSGDRIRVIGAGEPDLTGNHTVDAAGNIRLALGDPVPVRGLTADQAARAIVAS